MLPSQIFGRVKLLESPGRPLVVVIFAIEICNLCSVNCGEKLPYSIINQSYLS